MAKRGDQAQADRAKPAPRQQPVRQAQAQQAAQPASQAEKNPGVNRLPNSRLAAKMRSRLTLTATCQPKRVSASRVTILASPVSGRARGWNAGVDQRQRHRQRRARATRNIVGAGMQGEVGGRWAWRR